LSESCINKSIFATENRFKKKQRDEYKMYKILAQHKELLPLLGFVVSGVTVGTSMFLYKLATNPNIRIDKQKRQQIFRDG